MHVIFRETHGLDEAAVPTDLRQSPADLVVLSFSDSDLGAFAAAWHRAQGALPSLRLANLAALKLTFTNLVGALPAPVRAELEPLLDDAIALLADTDAGIREICTTLRPATLDYSGLLPALREYVAQFRARTGLDVRIDAESGSAPPTLSRAAQTLCFRLVQEALTNCAKHARAGSVRIELRAGTDGVLLQISDDGVGFDLSRLGEAGSTPGLGLITMRERVELAGGHFRLYTRPGDGTVIEVRLPAGPHPGETTR